MRKFKELVGYFNYQSIDYKDSDVHSIMAKSNQKLMLGTVVRLENNIIIPSDSSSFDIMGIVIENNSDMHCIATCGTVQCICRLGKYEIGDYIKTCNVYGVGAKHVNNKGFNIPLDAIKNMCFAQVIENKDLRTTQMGFINVKLLGKYSCTICSTKSI